MSLQNGRYYFHVNYFKNVLTFCDRKWQSCIKCHTYKMTLFFKLFNLSFVILLLLNHHYKVPGKCQNNNSAWSVHQRQHPFSNVTIIIGFGVFYRKLHIMHVQVHLIYDWKWVWDLRVHAWARRGYRHTVLGTPPFTC